LVVYQYTAVPTVAFFGSTFGIGITGELGSRTIEYLQQVDATEADPEYFYEQFSETQYMGAGLHGYILIPRAIMPKIMKGTVSLGGRSLTADVKSNGVRTVPETVPESTKITYDITILEAGLSFSLTLAKRYLICPWVNYPKTSFGSVSDPNQSSDDLAEENRGCRKARSIAYLGLKSRCHVRN
jgi:hypothetical protein